VPDLTGTTVSAAQQLLRGAGLKYVDGGARPSALPAGQVDGADPAYGTLVTKGANVTVFTSDGSLSATVPAVNGKKYKDALADLQSAGFDAGKATIAGFQAGDGRNQCQVVGTDPAAGSAAAKDAAVGMILFGTPEGGDPGTCS